MVSPPSFKRYGFCLFLFTILVLSDLFLHSLGHVPTWLVIFGLEAFMGSVGILLWILVLTLKLSIDFHISLIILVGF